MLRGMKLFRLILALIVLVVAGLAVATIGGFLGQNEATEIGTKVISILAILGVAVFAASKLLRG